MPAPVFDPQAFFPAPPASRADPGELASREVMFGGRPHVLRPLTPEDEGLLISFFNSHTEETIRQRYGYHVGEMTHERARRLVNVDQAKDLAFGVFERAGDGGEVLHAVGRYLLDPDGRSAEMAFVVRETKRRLGICTTLVRTLLHVARTRGLGYLHAQVQIDNGAMLSIFRRHGARMRPIFGAGAVEAYVPTALP
ncbi:MAG: hypothetical protein A3G75_03345 [Verrucomicrobia bacterium RIFCSPLOWO2_12_FULL_64_8]|nr:MAG: hypothetical protein A3G75_03345 [Verrucomicrobia bacterium RIFCSPLOWO2_12_FULL_64_8]